MQTTLIRTLTFLALALTTAGCTVYGAGPRPYRPPPPPQSSGTRPPVVVVNTAPPLPNYTAGSVWYYGYHPHSPTNNPHGGFCYINGAHSHAWAPYNQHLYVWHDGYYYWTGDPSPWGYQYTTYAYYGHHPLPHYFSGWCYINSNHQHHYRPRHNHHYRHRSGTYYYTGSYDSYYHDNRHHYDRRGRHSDHRSGGYREHDSRHGNHGSGHSRGDSATTGGGSSREGSSGSARGSSQGRTTDETHSGGSRSGGPAVDDSRSRFDNGARSGAGRSDGHTRDDLQRDKRNERPRDGDGRPEARKVDPPGHSGNGHGNAHKRADERRGGTQAAPPTVDKKRDAKKRDDKKRDMKKRDDKKRDDKKRDDKKHKKDESKPGKGSKREG